MAVLPDERYTAGYMVVGICQVRLVFHDVFSLKEKRGIVKRIMSRVRSKFPVSIAEVDDNDLWQTGVLGFCMIGNDRAFINSCLDKVLDYIENLYLADVGEHQIELINV